MIDLALILAAGTGSRLGKDISVPHKALTPVGGTPVLLHTCRALEEAGIHQVIVVTGYRGETIRALLENSDWRFELTFAENTQWQLANGLSVLAAKEQLTGNFLLMMADHLLDPGIISSLRQVSLGPQEVILAVDRKLDTIYDMEDATKVKLVGERIVAIHKELADFNAVDTGLFSCSPALMSALEAQTAKGNCSLSDGIRQVAEAGNLRYFDIGSAWWQDIDTLGALHHAEHLLRIHPSPAEGAR